MTIQDASLFYKAECHLGEGMMWHKPSKRIYWVDIEGRKLHSLNTAGTGYLEWAFDQRVTTIVPDTKGRLVLGMQNGIARFDPDRNNLEWLIDLEADKPENRCNDGKCDPWGNFWIGTMSLKETAGAGALYRISPDLEIKRMIDRVSIPNGIVWRGKSMYYNDTPERCVDEYDVVPDSVELSFKRKAVDITGSSGSPDGMAIDEKGTLWIAHFGGHGVYNWDPRTGKLLGKIDLPVPNVTSCAFGGDDLQTLFITTARHHLREKDLANYPLSGSLFSVRLPVKGLLPGVFKG